MLKRGLLIVALILSGCTNMKVEDFSGATPQLRLEEYFLGKTHAWGIFEDRFGTVRRQFSVTIDGSWDGSVLTLDEHFVYSDGETDRRVWRITKVDAETYHGRADDIVGIAVGRTAGNALNWRYDMDLKVGDRTWRVHFEDWMFLQEDGVLINRARVSKLGITLGEVTLFFMKEQPDAEMTQGNRNTLAMAVR